MYEKLPQRIEGLWKNLSDVLNAFGAIGDRLDPAKINSYADTLAIKTKELKNILNEIEPVYSSDNSTEYAIIQAASQAIQAVDRFETARVGPHEILKAYQSFRPMHRAEEILYPLTTQYEDISKHFLHPSQKENRELLDQFYKSKTTIETLEAGNSGSNTEKRGIIEVNNKRGQRGGYTLYIPEYYEANSKYPLVVALHGGSGHGADFFWSWLRDARTFGFILATPTSLDRTWSLHSIATDANRLNKMLSEISSKWNIDTKHILLTGLSDGGTYTMLLSIAHQSPFTHYAPVASAAHVLINRNTGTITAPVKDIPIYQVHGGKDWMFPVASARLAANALEKAGAKIIYKEIPELSHNYPRDENINILKWFYPEWIEGKEQ
jgi:phospholipase/carboxylesterase